MPIPSSTLQVKQHKLQVVQRCCALAPPLPSKAARLAITAALQLVH